MCHEDRVNHPGFIEFKEKKEKANKNLIFIIYCLYELPYGDKIQGG